MGGFPVPTYALVGEGTMAKPTFPKTLSWKHGFLENKLKRTYNRNANKNDLQKEPMNVACLDATITPEIYQRQSPTGLAVATTATATSAATDPALLPTYYKGSDATFQTSHVRHTPANISATLLLSPRKAPIPYKTAGFDEGDLHHTLPIRGLLPENKFHNDNTKEVRPTQFIKPSFNLATTPQKIERSQTTPDSQTDWIGLTDVCNKQTCHNSPNRYPHRWR